MRGDVAILHRGIEAVGRGGPEALGLDRAGLATLRATS
jgi:hypothetical protein